TAGEQLALVGASGGHCVGPAPSTRQMHHVAAPRTADAGIGAGGRRDGGTSSGAFPRHRVRRAVPALSRVAVAIARIRRTSVGLRHPITKKCSRAWCDVSLRHSSHEIDWVPFNTRQALTLQERCPMSRKSLAPAALLAVSTMLSACHHAPPQVAQAPAPAPTPAPAPAPSAPPDHSADSARAPQARMAQARSTIEQRILFE